MNRDEDLVAVEVVGVRVEIPSNQPLVLLREREGSVHLPIWIGANEAASIAMALQGVIPARPLTHDLFATTLAGLGVKLAQVAVVDLREGVFFAELRLGSVCIGARPSDAIALALRCNAPVYVARAVLAEAGIEITDPAEDEVAKFVEFLDAVSPEDFH